MPLQATSGAASYDAFGGGVPVVPNYIEEVFSCFLFTGTGAAQTITNNIDLSTKGGLVLIKPRIADTSNNFYDTARGVNKILSSDNDGAESASDGTLTAFNTNGFSIGTSENASVNGSNNVSWTFRKQPKFFDVVTWTGNGANRTIAHNLGSVPGCIIIKRRNLFSSWSVYHRSLANTKYLTLNTNDDASTDATTWNSTTATSTVFSLGTDDRVNASGGTYVAYVFAHDAGGFGLTGTDNVISCGSFTTGTGFGAFNVNLGWEPQWVLIKRTDGFRDWVIYDTMRGFNTRNLTGDADASALYPNLSSAEDLNGYVGPYATGFSSVYTGTASANYIYIAIRRGPMKVPTSGTSVFDPVAYTGTGTNNRIITSSITPDSVIPAYRNDTGSKYWYDRLRGNGTYLVTSGTNAEGTDGAVNGPQFNKVQTGYQQGTGDSGFINNSSYTYINYLLKRAPSFFDEVCYTGTGSATTFSHNLAAVPELMIVKRRSAANAWAVYANNDNTDYLVLNTTAATADDNTYWNDTSPTSSVFSVGTNNAVNASASTYVAYLFATCAGVSKVGSYTGNGSTQTIDCGFGAGGARFVVIKRTDSTGGWYVYDTARGMTVLTDPYLFLNDSSAESATLGSVTTVSTGFALNSTILAAINVSAGTYIFLAIA